MKALKKAPRPLRLTFWRASLGGADVLSGEAVEEEALLETMDGSVQDSLDAAAAAQDSLQDIAQGIAKAERLATEARAAEAVRGAADEYDDMHHQDGATPLGRPGAASDGEAEASDDDAGEPEEPEEEAPEDEAPEEPEEAPEDSRKRRRRRKRPAAARSRRRRSRWSPRELGGRRELAREEKDNVARELEEVAEDARHYRSRLGEAERASRASVGARRARRRDELASVLEREREEAAAARATAKIAEEAKARLEADATREARLVAELDARASVGRRRRRRRSRTAPRRRSWTATSRASSPAWTWPTRRSASRRRRAAALARVPRARRARARAAGARRTPAARRSPRWAPATPRTRPARARSWVDALDAVTTWCAARSFPVLRGTPLLVALFDALAGVAPPAAFLAWRRGAADRSTAKGDLRADVASVALRHTDAWFDRPIEAPVLSPPAKALPWTFGSATGARTVAVPLGLDDAEQFASPLSPRPADDGELELAGELAYACGAGAPLDRRGAALAVAASAARARGAACSALLRNLPAAVVFDADAPWAAPGAAGAALEALLEFDVAEQAAAVGAVVAHFRVHGRAACLNDALRKLATERLFDWLDGRDDEDLDDDVDDDEEEDHGSVAEAPRAPLDASPAAESESEDGYATARNRATARDEAAGDGARRAERCARDAAAASEATAARLEAMVAERGAHSEALRLDRDAYVASLEARLRAAEAKMAAPPPPPPAEPEEETPEEVAEMPADPKLRERFLRLLCAASGALLEDDDCLVRVAVERAYEGAGGRVRVEVANASSSPIRDLRVDVFADDGRDAGEAPKLSLAVRFETRDAAGEVTRHAYALRLPVAATCFAAPDGFNARDVKAFRARWDDVGAVGGTEHQIVVSSRSPVDDKMLDDLRTRVVADALKGAPVKHADVSPFTITAASVVHATSGPVDVLLRLEANAAARAFRITVRSPSPDAAAAFARR
ncbi:hypothetical protein JL720_3417 [Aureococcus anophagefferens]|nr:hypothetical protein JL720_3417 [Aureococcus anophagefferens]